MRVRSGTWAQTLAAWSTPIPATGSLPPSNGENDVVGNNVLLHTEAVAPFLTDPDRAGDQRYPVFFRPVDPEVITGPGGLADTRGFARTPIQPSTALSNFSFRGNDGQDGHTERGSGGTIRFDSAQQMDGLDYELAIDVDDDGDFGDGGDVSQERTLDSAGGNSFAWNGKTASGDPVACGTYDYRVGTTLAEAHLTQSDVENSAGTRIERLTGANDPSLGDPLAANYNDADPYKGGLPVTNTSPLAATDAPSGPGFHAWSANTGNTDFVDTWTRLPEVSFSKTLEVRCSFDTIIVKAPVTGNFHKTILRYRAIQDGFKAQHASFECKLDRPGNEGEYKSCKKPRIFRKLKPGKYHFEVFATSKDGVVDRTPAEADFTINPVPKLRHTNRTQLKVGAG
jgi:hypothetical protein